MLRRALSTHLVEGVSAPPNYSVQLAGHDAGPETSDFHFVYRGFDPVVRTRDLRRLVNALFAHMSTHVPDDGALLRLDTVAFVGAGEAVIAPPDLRRAIAALERRMNIKGFRIVDLPWSLLDPATGELVVPEPALTVDTTALRALEGITGHATASGARTAAKRRRPEIPVAPGRYPVVGWAFGRGRDLTGPLSTSVAVSEAARLVRNLSAVGPERTLEGLATVMAAAAPVALWSDQPEGLVAPLLALAG